MIADHRQQLRELQLKGLVMVLCRVHIFVMFTQIAMLTEDKSIKNLEMADESSKEIERMRAARVAATRRAPGFRLIKAMLVKRPAGRGGGGCGNGISGVG